MVGIWSMFSFSYGLSDTCGFNHSLKGVIVNLDWSVYWPTCSMVAATSCSTSFTMYLWNDGVTSGRFSLRLNTGESCSPTISYKIIVADCMWGVLSLTDTDLSLNNPPWLRSHMEEQLLCCFHLASVWSQRPQSPQRVVTWQWPAGGHSHHRLAQLMCGWLHCPALGL